MTGQDQDQDQVCDHCGCHPEAEWLEQAEALRECREKLEYVTADREGLAFQRSLLLAERAHARLRSNRPWPPTTGAHR